MKTLATPLSQLYCDVIQDLPGAVLFSSFFLCSGEIYCNHDKDWNFCARATKNSRDPPTEEDETKGSNKYSEAEYTSLKDLSLCVFLFCVLIKITSDPRVADCVIKIFYLPTEAKGLGEQARSKMSSKKKEKHPGNYFGIKLHNNKGESRRSEEIKFSTTVDIKFRFRRLK